MKGFLQEPWIFSAYLSREGHAGYGSWHPVPWACQRFWCLDGVSVFPFAGVSVGAFFSMP